MKKLAILSSLFLLALNSCSNEEIVNEEMLPGYEKQISVVAEDLVPAHGTRTSYTDNGNGYSFAWSEGDALGIFPKDGFQTIFPLGEGDGVGSNTAIFDGGKWALRPNESYAAYYPLVDKVSLDYNDIPIDYTGQVQNGNGNTDHLSAYDFMASTFTKVDAKGNVNFKLHHLGCLVQFKLTMPEADTYSGVEIISDKTPFITHGEYSLFDENHALKNVQTDKRITIALNDISTTETDNELTIFAMFAPTNLSDSKLTLKVTGSAQNYIFIVEGKDLVQGKAVKNNPTNDDIPYVSFHAEAEQTLTMSKAVTNLEYSVNDETWTTLGVNTITFGGENGDLRLRGKNPNGTATSFENGCFSKITFGNLEPVTCSGDIRTLVDYDNYLDEDIAVDARFCFLFQNCSVLTSAPKLPAPKLADNCYFGMFEWCNNLTIAPELPAELLTTNCYSDMFFGCTNLTKAPELQSTTLATACYSNMFGYCINLTTAPELPATSLADWCYSNMFQGCTSLNYVKMMATDISADYCLSNWLEEVSSTGTFVKNSEAKWNKIGASGVPEGWMIYDENGKEYGIAQIPYLTFHANGYAVFKFIKSSVIETIEYSLNNGEWLPLPDNEGISYGNEYGDIRLRGKNPYGTAATFVDRSIISNDFSDVSCTGDIRTLIDYENYIDANTSDARFIGLFYNCNQLVTAPELPSTNLASNCYQSMFGNCRKLTKAPALPAKTLAESCYEDMFYNCSALTEAPALEATTLAESCYAGMFNYCTSLVKAPALHAKTLAERCYYEMFSNCTSLVKAPELDATSLAEKCYSYMFFECSSLEEAPLLNASELASSCYANMFGHCTSLKEAPELPAPTLAEKCYSYMFSGCTSLTKAPDLLARNVPSYCYENMFYGCSSLNYVKMMASVFGLQSNWLQGVSSTGTFIKNSALYCEDSDLGIPDGWVLEAEEEIGNFHKGHEYVDLGLPSGTLWATCNIDVKGHQPIPNRSGYYLAWGEIETKDRFGNSYPYSGRYTEDGEEKYYDWGQDIRNTDHDIVHLIWEGDWSIPSTDDFAELINNCTWDWEPLNGTNGYKVTSKVNDNWIFLPVSGYKAQSHYNSYDGGYYWSSELDTDDISKSFALVFSSSQVITSSFDRDKGLVVRPVIRVNK